MPTDPDQIACLPETDAFPFSCMDSSFSPLTEAETRGEALTDELAETLAGADGHLLVTCPLSLHVGEGCCF